MRACMDKTTRPRKPIPGTPPWEQLELFTDEPQPMRNLLVAWAMGYSPADDDDY